MGGRSGGLPALSGVRAGTAGKQKLGEEVSDILGLERGIPKSALTLKKRECCPCRGELSVSRQVTRYPTASRGGQACGCFDSPSGGRGTQPLANASPHSLRAGEQGPGLWGGLKGVLDTCSASTKPYEGSVAGT